MRHCICIIRKICPKMSWIKKWKKQLLCMGIMGQYLAKTYLEVKNRPHYIISETNDKDAKRIG